MSAVQECQEKIFKKIDDIDVKIDNIRLNGVAKNGVAKLNAYKIGLWGWFVRVVCVAGVGAVITYLVQQILIHH